MQWRKYVWLENINFIFKISILLFRQILINYVTFDLVINL